MKTSKLLITAITIIVMMFLFDGLFHGLLMKSFYDKQTASFYYPPEQQKLSYLFFSEITLFGVLTFFVSKAASGNSVLTGALLGAFFCIGMGGTFVLVNSALMPGWGKTLSVVEVSWNTFQGAIAGTVVVLFKNHFERRAK